MKIGKEIETEKIY